MTKQEDHGPKQTHTNIFIILQILTTIFLFITASNTKKEDIEYIVIFIVIFLIIWISFCVCFTNVLKDVPDDEDKPINNEHEDFRKPAMALGVSFNILIFIFFIILLIILKEKKEKEGVIAFVFSGIGLISVFISFWLCVALLVYLGNLP